MGERVNGIHEVRGSIPLGSTNIFTGLARSGWARPRKSLARAVANPVRTIFAWPGGMSRLIPIGALLAALLLPAAAAGADPDPKKGRDISIKHCSRCHVIGDYNRFGGIDATPSFQSLANRRPDFVERLRTFYQRRPHPVFVRVPDVPRWTDLPSAVTEFTVTPEDIEDVIAFVKTLKKK